MLYRIGVRFHLCSKLEVNDVIKRKCADDARSTLLGAGVCARSLWGAALGYRQLVPGDNFYRRGPGLVLISFARAGHSPTCMDARESAQILEENLAPV